MSRIADGSSRRQATRFARRPLLLVCVVLGVLLLCSAATMTRVAAEGDAPATAAAPAETAAAGSDAAMPDIVYATEPVTASPSHNDDDGDTDEDKTNEPPHDTNTKHSDTDDDDDSDDDDDDDDDDTASSTRVADEEDAAAAAHDEHDVDAGAASVGADGVEELPMRCLAIFARAHDTAKTSKTQQQASARAADDDDGVDAATESTTHVLFPTLMPGMVTRATLAYENAARTHNHTLVLAVGYLQPQHDVQMVLQNFSVVRHARVVRPGETVSVDYHFRVSEFVEPGEYNLVLALYVQIDGMANAKRNSNNDSANNNNIVLVPAFNATVMVAPSSGTDARMAMTYVTLLAMLASLAYAVAWRFGLLKYAHHVVQWQQYARQLLRGSSNSGDSGAASGGAASGGRARASAASSSSAGEAGEAGAHADYDVEYVSAEHLRYREKLLAAQQRGRHASASPGKKKSRN